MIDINEVKQNDKVIGLILDMSLEFENENISYGYTRNEKSDLEGRRIFIAKIDNIPIGYLFGRVNFHSKTSVIPEGTKCFEIEEIYVKRDYRSKEVGRKLFEFSEKTLIKDEISFITLSATTKNYRALLRFYIDICGMEFWYAKLFKKIDL